jgi:hypothetical protein
MLQLLHYNIDIVPSFVALNSQNKAVAKSSPAKTEQQVLSAFHEVLKSIS